MSKFKSIKEYLRPRKCIALIRRIFASSSPKIAKRHSNNENRSDSAVSTSSAEGFISLIARDSEVIDLSFYNPHFDTRREDDECEEELQQISDSESTSDGAKLFGDIKNSRNVLSAERQLTSAQEMSKEDWNQSQSSAENTPPLHQPANESAQVRQSQTRRSVSGNEASASSNINDDDDPGTKGRKMHLKRRKRSERKTQPLSTPSATARDSHVDVAESDDSLMSTQEHRVNISPQRRREKMRMMKGIKGAPQQKDSATTGIVADNEDNVN